MRMPSGLSPSVLPSPPAVSVDCRRARGSAPGFLAPLGVVVLGLILASGCNSGVIEPGGNSTAPGSPSNNAAAGFDPGVALTGPGGVIQDRSVAGARIPGVAGEKDLEIVLYAFTTVLPASHNVGGRQLVPGSADTNGAGDVFLAAIRNTSVRKAGRAEPSTFSQALAPLFRSQSCTVCHGFYESPPSLAGHPGGVLPNNVGCEVSGCHLNLLTSGDDRRWRAPTGLDLRGRSDQELCDLMADPAIFATTDEAVDHLKNDARIVWTISDGKLPAGGPSGGQKQRPNVSLERWRSLVDAWEEGGFVCDDSDAVEEIVLVSQNITASDVAGNAASGEPSLTFVPNPGFDPARAISLAGTAYIAHASEATDLVGVATNGNRQIIQALIDVFVSRGGGERSIDLVYRGQLLVSRPLNGSGVGGNGDSSAPSISSDGQRIAFASLATDMVAGFTDNNGADAPDVYLRDIPTGVTALVSESIAGAGEGGDGPSGRPATGAAGDAVAFESRATDLVADDFNGVQDVLYALISPPLNVKGAIGDPPTLEGLFRASVRSGGAEGRGGDSRAPDIHVIDRAANEILVVFESNKTDLVAPRAVTAVADIYLHDSRLGGVTELVSQSPAGEPGDGASRAPRFSPNGNAVVFETEASNLDGVRPEDTNGVTDVILSDLAAFLQSGRTSARRLSITSGGEDANGASTRALVAGFQGSLVVCDDDVFVTYTTAATNVGRAANSDTVFVFLGQEDTASEPPGEPACEIAATPAGALLGESVGFTASGPGTATTLAFEWSFGDDARTTTASPTTTHAYDGPGEFTVRLDLNDGQGNCEFCETTVTVTNRPPECEFLVEFQGQSVPVQQSLFQNVVYTFDGSDSSEPDAGAGDSIVLYEWDFGDGGTASGASVTHVYQDLGAFTASLTLTDSFGGTTTCTRTVNVAPSDNGTPTCNLSADRSIIDVNEAISFNANASDPDGHPITIDWDFGDGQTASGLQQRSHTFITAAESLTVRVTITDQPPIGLPPATRECTLDIVVGEKLSNIPLAGCANFSPTSCHGGVIAPSLSNDASQNYDNFDLNIPDPEDRVLWCLVQGTPTEIMVIEGDPDNSYLIKKLQDGLPNPSACGDGSMASFMSDTDLARLRSWIAAGAKNN